MAKVSLMFKTIELTNDGMLIKTIDVIDSVSGETIRIGKITTKLIDFFKMLEIPVDDFFTLQDMKRKNPAFTKLCNTFKLYNDDNAKN